MSESLIFTHFLFFVEQCEWIAHSAQIKWAMWANHSFRSPKMSDYERFAQRKWAMWANRSFCWPKMSKWVNRSFLSESLIFEWIAHFWANRSFAHFWTKNVRFAWKSNERIPSPCYKSISAESISVVCNAPQRGSPRCIAHCKVGLTISMRSNRSQLLFFKDRQERKS